MDIKNKCSSVYQGNDFYYKCDRAKDHGGVHISQTGQAWYDDERAELPHYITTESLNCEDDVSGSIHMTLSEANSAEHLTHVDLRVVTSHGRQVILERVDTDKLRYMCDKAEEADPLNTRR